jgi:hypothetical protein
MGLAVAPDFHCICSLPGSLASKGPRFSVTFNGKQLFEVEDSTFADAGKVGSV